jgi:hypothetical protein
MADRLLRKSFAHIVRPMHSLHSIARLIAAALLGLLLLRPARS